MKSNLIASTFTQVLIHHVAQLKKLILWSLFLGLLAGAVSYPALKSVKAQSPITPPTPQVGSGSPKSNASSSKAGTILFFHAYTSDTSQVDKVNTIINLTNTNPVDAATLRLIAVHDCTTDEKFINLAANQSRSLLASKEFPDSTGYLIAMVVNSTGAPTQFNWIVGSATVRDWQNYEGSYNAFAVAKRTAGAASGNGKTFDLKFDGQQFDQLPQTIALDNLQSVNAEFSLYSLQTRLGDPSSFNDFTLKATVYDQAGKDYPSTIPGLACGLIDIADSVWSNQALAKFIKPGNPGWATFKVQDVSDSSKVKDAPIFGVSFSSLTGKPKHGAVNLQVLSWLETYSIALAAKIPNILSAPESLTQDQVEPINGAAGASESKAGSLLLFPRFVSGNLGSTLINVTNTHPTQKARVRLFFTSVAPTAVGSEKIVTIEPLQAKSIKASDVAPNQRGWVMAMAINSGAQASKFNYLIGSSQVIEASGLTTTFNALAVAKNSDGAVARNSDLITADLIFDDAQFDRLPSVWVLSAIPNQTSNNSYLSYNRFGASLLDVPTTRGGATVKVFDNSLVGYTALLGATETKLGDMTSLRFNPTLPAAALQASAGWMKVTVNSPTLAVYSNTAISPVTPTVPEGWSGGLTGSGSLHIFSTMDSFTLKVPSGNPNNHVPLASFDSSNFNPEARSIAGTIIRLDATSSSDEDPEDTLSYEWYDNGKLVSIAVLADYRMSIGHHELMLVVTDTSGQSGDPFIETFDVKDTKAPTISRLPSAISLTTSGTGAAATFTLPVAYDSIDGWVNVVASRPSGSIFLLGTHTVTFTATDKSGNKATATLEITVSTGSNAPQTGGVAGSAAPFLANLNDQYVKPGELRQVTLQADDLDGDSVTFRLLGTAARVSLGNFDPVQRKATLLIGPINANAVPAVAQIQVSDNHRQNYMTLPFLIAVSEIPNDDTGSGIGPTGGGRSNRAPKAVMAPLPPTIEATDVSGIVLQLDGTASTDPDLDSLTYQWSDNGQVIAQGVMAEVKLGVGSHTIVLTVNDGRGGINSTLPAAVQVTSRQLSVRSIDPIRMSRGQEYAVVVTGTGFVAGARIYLGDDINSSFPATVTESTITTRVAVSGAAALGTRDVYVINPDGRVGRLRAGFRLQ